MRFRKLRIAWSVGWGLVAALLTVLWVRSYWQCDVVRGPFRGELIVNSLSGSVTATHYPPQANTIFPTVWGQGWEHLSFPAEARPPSPGSRRFVLRRDANGIVSSIPHWFAVIVVGALAATSWFPLVSPSALC
jgi:hypothetical protein